MKAKSALIASIATVGIANAAQAQVWAESGDAGTLPGTAQSANGVGALTSITGSISPAGDIDLYLINISNEAAFGATTLFAAGSDYQLYLFQANGTAVAFNDDASGSDLRPILTSALVTANGNYLIGITRYDADALNAGAVDMWSTAPFTGQSAPNNPGVLTSWSASTSATVGAYTINLTGASFVPAPGALALLGMAGMIGRNRRRR